MDGATPWNAERLYWGSADDEVVSAPQPARIPPARDDADERLPQLARMIESEIIPRLMLAHRRPTAALEALEAPAMQDIVEFGALVLAHDSTLALSYVEALRARGTTLETVYLQLLAPTARHLGKLWEADACDFTEVTLGLCRLQQVLNQLRSEFCNEAEHPRRGRRALLVSAPGEQHTFGLSMVAEFFRRAGWDVWGGLSASREELISLVRAEWFGVIGFSVSCETRLETVAAAIREIRRESRNRFLGVMVGGQVFVGRPELVALVGADATAMDARLACLQAESLLALLARAEAT
jgi:methanogenic corrinoid protein MtbC1